jgi:hypothetical protein
LVESEAVFEMPASHVTVTVADFAPIVVGFAVTVNPQEPLVFTMVAPQVLAESVNSAALVPEIAGVVQFVASAVPELVSVNAVPAELVLINVSVNVFDVGL